MMGSGGDRELTKTIINLTNQLQQLVLVNQTFSQQLMLQEKAFVDEKRARLDLE